MREIERSVCSTAQQDAPRWPEEVLGQTVSAIRQWPDKPLPPWCPALLLLESSCCWLSTGGASRRCVQTPRQAARSLDPAVEARSCAGSGLRGAVSASGSGGQIWWGDLAPGPDASIWPLRRGLTQDLAGGARCWDLAQHGQILGSGQQARSCVRSGHAGGISHWGVTFDPLQAPAAPTVRHRRRAAG